MFDFISHPLDPAKLAQPIVAEGARSVLNNEGARFEARGQQVLNALTARLRAPATHSGCRAQGCDQEIDPDVCPEDNGTGLWRGQ